MFDWIPTWEHDREIITQRILEQKSDLKIVLKTKDEIYLLRRWLDHHIEIVGLGNIIVFDNNSSNPLISDIYLEYRDRIVVARFSDYPDDIHHPDRFPDLYSSLRESSRFFSFLDTDEYLIWMNDDGTWMKGRAIVQAIMARSHARFFPGSWIGNVPFFDDRFYVSSGEDESNGGWAWGLKWGKPILASDIAERRSILHNSYIDFTILNDAFCTSVFILHIASFSREQRINANMRKLRAIKFISESEPVESVLQIAQETIEHDLIRSYVDELRYLVDLGSSASTPTGELADHTLRINPDGTIDFFNETQKANLRKFLLNPREMITKFLKPDE